MKYLKKTPLIISFLSFITFITSVNADVKVVASIKPIHSLASYLMDGVGKPDLIVDGYASPHGFAMKPSHAKMLQEADLIFWVGEDLEAFLEKPLKSIAKKAEKIELMATKNLNVEKEIFLTNMITMIMVTTIMQRKKMIMMITMIMIMIKKQKKMMIMTTIMKRLRKKMTTITIMIAMQKRKMDMMITMIMMDTIMENLILTYG
jgi:hypothetical protein